MLKAAAPCCLAVCLLAAAGGAILASVTAEAQTTPEDTNGMGPAEPSPPLPSFPNAPGLVNGLPSSFFGSAVPPNLAPQPNQPPVIFLPSISGSEILDTNVNQSSSDPKTDLVTVITPRIDAVVNEDRVRLNLLYAPSGQIYARTSSANGVNQNLLANGTAEIVPGTLFLNARALATVIPTNGGLAGLGSLSGLGSSLTGYYGQSPYSPDQPGQDLSLPVVTSAPTVPGAAILGRSNRTQLLSGYISPYVTHAFGTFGTASAGVSYSETTESSTIQNPSAFIPGTIPPTWSRDTTEAATAQFLTGDDFGRIRDLMLVNAATSQGTGVTNGARSNVEANYIGYAFNRQILPYVGFGHQYLKFNTVQHTTVDSALWQVGVQYIPNPDSRITVAYGNQNGQTGFQANAYYVATARTRFSLTYRTGLTTDLQNVQNLLGLASFDQSGFGVNGLSGAPLLLGSSLLNSQTALYQSHSLSATMITVFDIDTLALSFQHYGQTPIGTAPGSTQVPLNQVSNTLVGSWQHRLSEVTVIGAAASVQINNVQAPSNTNEKTYAFSVGVAHVLGQNLIGVARYLLFDRQSQLSTQAFTANLFLLGVTKTF
ncbi:MAG TPA: hypothetical protein VFA03_05765 [Acetobacteraceae bacterium]|nr:hypothetical protein [Acetobacteraceae bacterium]